jgi:hypothetical protein
VIVVPAFPGQFEKAYSDTFGEDGLREDMANLHGDTQPAVNPRVRAEVGRRQTELALGDNSERNV